MQKAFHMVICSFPNTAIISRDTARETICVAVSKIQFPSQALSWCPRPVRFAIRQLKYQEDRLFKHCCRFYWRKQPQRRRAGDSWSSKGREHDVYKYLREWSLERKDWSRWKTNHPEQCCHRCLNRRKARWWRWIIWECTSWGRPTNLHLVSQAAARIMPDKLVFCSFQPASNRAISLSALSSQLLVVWSRY